ncbi:MAG: CTP-dependent riboflavin kinase [Desulfobacterota bacterium]|nr:CTP-dependent riboflavin kinase [Thermodesulfobacteriota bacterium]
MGGLKEANQFTQIPWVRRQFIEKLSIDPYPGTLNLQIHDLDSLRAYQDLKKREGIEIVPEDPSFCRARCYPVLIHQRLRGAIVLPLVEHYPENKVELIASQKIQTSLSLKEGDEIEIEVLLYPSFSQ